MLIANKNSIKETPTFIVTERGEKFLTSIATVRDAVKEDLYSLIAFYNQMKQNIDCGLIEDVNCVTMPETIDQQQMFNLCQLMNEIRFINNKGQEE